MFSKIIILIVILIILIALGSGLVFLIKDAGHSNRMVKALSVRIALSVVLFLFLLLAFSLGWITPH